MVIDFHTHAFPDQLAPRAMEKLQKAADWKAVSGGTVGELEKSMADSGIDASVICAIATKPGQVSGILDWCREIRSGKIIPFPSVHPGDEDVAKWVDRIAKEGFKGIKLHPMYQETAADDDSMAPIYEAAQANVLMIASHCGRDVAFPAGDDRASPVRFRRIIDEFEDLVLICTHMGGWRDWDAAERHIIGTHVYLETSFSIDELGPQRAMDMMLRHGVDHVLLGSDWPWQSQSHALGLVRSLPLSEDQKALVLGENAKELLG